MGFILMIISFLLGLFLVIMGISRRKNNHWYVVSIVIGILLVLFAIYLALPK